MCCVPHDGRVLAPRANSALEPTPVAVQRGAAQRQGRCADELHSQSS